MSRRSTHRPTTYGFQVVVCNTRNSTDARLATESKKLKYATHTGKKRNACNRFYPTSVAFFACVHCGRCSFFWSASHDQHALCPLCSVRQKKLKLTFKFVFVGLHTVSYTTRNATDTTQRLHSLQLNQKPKYTMHACKNHNARNHFYSLRALRFSCAYIACVASVTLRMRAWKLTFKSFFIACMLTRDIDIANLSVCLSICLFLCPLRSGIRWIRLNISS